MTRLHRCTDEEIEPLALEDLKAVRNKGQLAPVYRQMANSSHAVSAYLQMERAVADCSLVTREVEAIKLCVSELNRCDYCLSTHSVKSAAAGLTGEQQIAIRRGEPIGDSRLDCLVSVARQFFKSPGTLPQALIDSCRDAGVTDRELLDLVLVTSTIFLTNTFNHINDTALAFPAAPEL